MIHRIAKKKSDKTLLGQFAKAGIWPKEEPVDYKKVIVKKPWGYEYLLFQNESVAIWMLHIVRKRKTSLHAHMNKKTSLVLLSGTAKCIHLDGEIKLEAMDGVVIEEGAFHSTEAFSGLSMEPQSENGIWVMEIETPPVKTDLLRFKDKYGRKGASYEGSGQMVFVPRKCIKLKAPGFGKIQCEKFLNCTFKIMNGRELKEADYQNKEGFVSSLGSRGLLSKNPDIKAGEIVPMKDFFHKNKNKDLSRHLILTIEKEKKSVKVSDHIFSCIAELGIKDVFAVSGGAAMHLVDSLGTNQKLNYISVHHEQAAAMAAEAYARITGNLGVALVTSGPGGTNAITGVCGAWIDSIPTLFISGQVTTDTLIGKTGLRQFGIQETNITQLVKPITKYAKTVTDSTSVKYHLQKAIYLAKNGRPGPVWLDIPLDIQSKIINPDELPGFVPPSVKQNKAVLQRQVSRSLELLSKAKRPIVICGYGIRLARAEKVFLKMVESLKIPVVSSWTASDLIESKHALYVGRSGIMGDRAGNFAVQNSDLLLILGSRMSIPQVGYQYKTFAREAKKIMVDIDEKELRKPSLKLDLSIQSDAKDFVEEVLTQCSKKKMASPAKDWAKKCQSWKSKYPIVLKEYALNKTGVNSFHFIDVLSKKMGSEAIIVTDMGTSFSCTMQTFQTKIGQRFFTSSGHASMGFGLPGAIGACLCSIKQQLTIG